tara:strand:- start:135 stop:251 length:117 start_codon:yes stop_codon:yes gene_type:complete
MKNLIDGKWKKISLIIVLVVIIELSGHGIIASLYRLLS